MKCHCGATAFYRVAARGFCGKHHAEAKREQEAIVRSMNVSATEYERNQRTIERAMRMGDTRFKTHRRHA